MAKLASHSIAWRLFFATVVCVHVSQEEESRGIVAAAAVQSGCFADTVVAVRHNFLFLISCLPSNKI
jgi:hypothetical protein